ncbi:MAG: type II secretion system protein [Phycisphaerales bacterium]|nr:type II secretion system protein [Phycisphaerales bacterium]
MNGSVHVGRGSNARLAFTLIEVLVVIAIMAILVAILLPALGMANKTAKAAACMGNLRGIGQGLVLYNHDNKEGVVPSYNMTGTDGGPDVPLDGWGPILDRDGYMGGAGTKRGNPFYCPDTYDVAGVATGQTGSDPNNSKGWHDWPFIRTTEGNFTQLIPERGFHKIIRVSYWINADNPIGAVASVTPDMFYTGSVGYGPSHNGVNIKLTRLNAFVRPVQLIAVADGLYAGRQRDNQAMMSNSRIGFRHPGKMGAANTAFADGHVAPIHGKEFPRGMGGNNTLEEIRAENGNGKPSVYANPEKILWPGG